MVVAEGWGGVGAALKDENGGRATQEEEEEGYLL